ncbi:DUF3883 domain-containing protein (plasmid) [Acetobacter orientalis]|uniref:DUF3883 domain-containing protein n=1 Tax=Acetobacter orientalis TaxID=146474 RepID=UPI0038673402
MASLTELGNATIESWVQHDVANVSKADEFARIALLLAEARRLGAENYLDYIKYWGELRASFDPYKLINNWDALFTLNYLDHELDGFAPGSILRDEKVPVEAIEYDLDDYVQIIDASQDARNGAEQVARAIEGKIPRGRARATLCIALEILAEPEVDPKILLQAFGYPKRPRQWSPFSDLQIDKAVSILSSIGIQPVHGSGVPVPTKSQSRDQKSVISLPETIDFEKSVRGAPQLLKKKIGTSNRGARKIDHQRRQERNGAVGRLGEEFVLRYEQWRLREHPELLKRIKHVSLEDDTVGYDIESFEINGKRRLVEVKATQGPLETRFFLSAGERIVAESNPSEYVLIRVGNLKEDPILCELRHPFNEIELTPSIFEARFITIENDTASE